MWIQKLPIHAPQDQMMFKLNSEFPDVYKAPERAGGGEKKEKRKK